MDQVHYLTNSASCIMSRVGNCSKAAILVSFLSWLIACGTYYNDHCRRIAGTVFKLIDWLKSCETYRTKTTIVDVLLVPCALTWQECRVKVMNEGFLGAEAVGDNAEPTVQQAHPLGEALLREWNKMRTSIWTAKKWTARTLFDRTLLSYRTRRIMYCNLFISYIMRFRTHMDTHWFFSHGSGFGYSSNENDKNKKINLTSDHSKMRLYHLQYPHWGKKLKPDLHWKRCVSEKLLKRFLKCTLPCSRGGALVFPVGKMYFTL